MRQGKGLIMNSKAKILLMYANEYSLQDENGRQVSGCTINYFFYGEHGEAMKPQEGANGAIGYQRAKCSLPQEVRFSVIKAPALYEADFEMSIGSDGKPVMKVVGLQYLSDVSITAVNNGK